MRLFTAREIKIQDFILPEGGAVGPGGVLGEMGLDFVHVQQGDLCWGTGNDLLRFERKGCARRRIGRNLVGDLGQQQNKHRKGRN